MKAFYRLFYYISIVLTSILAGVTIAGAFVGNAAPDSFKFMPFIGLMLPILLLANLAHIGTQILPEDNRHLCGMQC